MKIFYPINLYRFFVCALFFVVSLTGKQAYSQDVFYVDSSAVSPGDGLGWATAFPSLQDALDIADAGDEVWVAEGTYYPDTNATTSNDVRDAAFELETGVELYGGFTGTENFRSGRNWQINVTILSGDIDQNDHTSDGIITDPDSIIGGNSYSVVRGNNTNATAILDGFTITGGSSNGATIDARRYGGGMFNSDGSPTVANVAFIGNKAVFGGGMANLDVSLPAVTNVHFINNEATNHGGGMYNTEQSHATLTNVIFYSNYAQNNGGGMYNRTGSDPELMNVLFSENVAGNNAGAMLNRDSSSPTITNVTIAGNVSEAGKTAGIYNGNTSTATLNNVIIWGNFSGTNTDTIAASINTNNASNPTISHSLIAHSGGSSGWNMDIGTDGGNNRDAYPIFLDAGDIDGADDVLGTPDDGLTLYSTSPAVNSGVNGAIPSGVTTDLAGQDRIFDQAVNPDVVDMGAYELQDEAQDPVQPDMNNIIYVDQNDFGGDQSGSSWSNAMPELRKALNWSRNHWDGSNPPLQIWVADGTYLPASGGSPRTSSFRLEEHVEIYGGFDGGEMNIGDRDWMTNVTVLSGDIDKNDITDTNGIVIDAGNLVGPNSYHVVNGSGSDSTAVLDGFFITAGRANGSGNNNLGGGLFMNNSNPTLNRLHFMGNWARLGGGMLNDNGSNPTLTDVTFSGNHASSDGGGMYNLSNCSPTLINVSFYDNQAVTRGGGIRNVTNSNPTLINVVFKGNQAYFGGGMFNGNECDPMLINVTFSGNRANNIGGGMVNEINCHPVIINSIFWNNQADGVTNTFSASIANVSGSSPTVSWSMVDNCNPGGNWVGPCGNNTGNNLPDMNPLFIDGPNPADAPIDIGNLRLQTSSPVINAGDNTPFGIGGVAENVVIDLDGNARIFDGLPNPDTIDLGAYEVQEEPTDDEPLPLSPDMNNVMYVDIHVDTAAMGYTGTGDSWANAVQKLQDALTWAQNWDATTNGILQIWVADGVYFPDEGVLQADNDRDAFFQLVNGVKVYGGFDGIEANLMDRDWRTHVAILSGDIDGNDISAGGIISEPDSIAGDNSYTVVNGSNTNDSAKIDGFTITGGKSNSSSSYIRQLGGGFFNNDGSPTVANITLRGNIARFGGGMGNYNESDPSLTNVIFYKNFAEQNGGGLFNHTHSSPVIVNAIFAENEASMHAGAIHNRDESSPTLVNVTIVGNTAPTGGAGGIRNGTDSETIMENVIIWGNYSGGDPDIPLASMFSANPTGVNISNSLIDNSGGSTNWDSDLGVDGGGNLDEDPLFLNIVDPDGLDDIFATVDDGLTLTAGSPVIGFGANAPFEMGGVAEGVTTDLVGFDRIFGLTVDMGAYESPDATVICPGSIAYVDSSASGSNNGTTWDNAFTDLQDALEAARSCPAVDSIFVAKGTYYPTPVGMNRDSSFVIPDSTVVLGGFPSMNATLTNRDWNANLTILSGDIDHSGDLMGNSYHVVTTVDVDSFTVVDGFTITGGNADGSILPDNAGGGWYNDGSDGGSSNPTILNTTFKNNSASLGGALYNDGNDGESSPKLVNNIFLSNVATSTGGAIVNEGDEGESSPKVINCLFQDNTAASGGGAIVNRGGDGTGTNTGESSPLIINCTFAGNSSDTGGAMYNISEGTSTACFPTIINSIFSDNSATTAGPVFLNSVSTGNLIVSIRYSLFDVALTDLNNNVQCPGCVDDIAGNKYSTEPDFVNAMAGDFHLADTSEAVNMGDVMTDLGVFLTDSIGMAIDLGGNSRVVDGRIDMGVYEYQNLAGICPVGVAYVDSTATGFNNGTSWNHAYTDLQDALEAVRNCGDIDSIFVAKGTYYPTPDSMKRDSSFVIPNSTVLLGGFPTGGGALAERKWEINKTILSGDIDTGGDNSDNSYHVITTVNVDPLTVVDGFTITGGSADGSPTDKGSGWYNVGAGMGNSSNPTIRHCRFINNSADNGGAMYNDGSDGGESSPLLVNCIFSGNHANFGGALFNDGFDGGESSPELDNCKLSGNHADLGGAIYNEGRGGVSSPLLVNCVLSGNQTDSDGAVMFNLGASGVASPVLVNCVLSGNRANRDGGVMYNYGAGGASSPKVTNSIFYNNDANDEGTVFYNIVASPVISYSMFDVTLADLNIGMVCTSCVTDVAGNKFSTDPQFIEAPMASAAPTTTGDFHPADTSMAVNMGNPMTDLSVFLTNEMGTEIDLDGNPRLFDGTIDMGVYESQVKILHCSDYPEGIVYVDSSANGINNGASWMDAFTDLQDALNVLRNCPNADSIFVAKGTYFPTSVPLDVDSSFVIPDSAVVLGGFPTGGGTLAERDWKINETVLSGDIGVLGDNTDNSYHVVWTNNVDSVTVVDGFTITEGNADGPLFPHNLGGGWFNDGAGDGSHPTIRNCFFSGNSAENNGGAMYNYGDGGSTFPSILNCVFSGNHVGSEGGAIYNNGSDGGNSSPEMVNCLFSGNSADGNGGAMYNNGSGGESSPELINCVFSGNHTNNNGGAILNMVPFSGKCSPELVNCVFSGNNADGNGGAMFNQVIAGETSPNVANCIFYNNEAALGAVFFNTSSVDLTVRNSLFDTTYAVLNTGCMACVDTSGGGNLYNSDPLFVDAPPGSAVPTIAGDFHLEMCSPAINAGDNAANMVMEDLDGNVRVFGDTIDMGAYEFQGQGGAAPNPVCPENFFVCYSASAFSLSMNHPGQPAGGTYSGSGVVGDLFTATDAGTGMHEIIYTYTDGNGCSDTCSFIITVGEETVVTCPADLTIAGNAAPVNLSGGMPAGGTFSGMGVSGNMFDPAMASMGVHAIEYSVMDDSSCVFTCTFTVTVTAATPADYEITTINNEIIITDIAGHGDTLVMSENGNNLRFIATGRTYSVDGGSVQTFPADVALAGVDSIRILPADGDDVVEIESFSSNFLPSLDINGGGGNDHVRFEGDIFFLPTAYLSVNMQDDVAMPGTDQITVLENTGIHLDSIGNVTFKVSKNILLENGSDVSVVDGNIVVEANRQTIPTSGQFQGVKMDSGILQSTGEGSISLYGRGGDDGSFNDNHGLVILGNSIVQTTAGTRIELQGIVGGGNSTSILMNNTAQVNAQAITSHIIFQGDVIHFAGGTVSTPDSVTIMPFTEDGSWDIDLSSTTDPVNGPLSLSDTELDLISAGLLIIGSETTDSIKISADIDRTMATNMEFICGSDIFISGGGIQTGGGTLILHPGDSPAAIYPRFDGTDVEASTLSFGSDISIEINGNTPGDGTGSTYTQLVVMGGVELTEDSLVLSGSHVVSEGESFVVLSNDGADAIAGTFTSLPEGSTISNILGSGLDALITYVGGDGNDVELTVLYDCTGIQVVYVDSMAGGNNDGSSWANAFTDLQDALRPGAACPDLDTILVAQGTYFPTPITTNRDTSFWIPDGVVVLGGFPGVAGDTTMARDWELYPTILSGDIDHDGILSGNSYHVVRTHNVDFTTIVDGFTISMGYADGNGGSLSNKGGGWYNGGSGMGNSSNPTIRNCRFINSLAFLGGAMFNDGGDGGQSSPVLVNCVFSGNKGDDSGGAMFNRGVFGGISSPVLTNCILSGNHAEFTGGAMYNNGYDGISSPELINCVLSGNSAKYGGAMYSYIVAGISSPKVTNSILYNNAADLGGPVFYNEVNTTPVVSHSLFGMSQMVVDHNSVIDFGDGNKFSTDPVFIDPISASAAPTSAGDFHLQPGSPAINMGINDSISVTTDLDGLPRIQNGIVDMGAYEYQGSIDCQVLNGIAYVDASAGGNNDGSSWTHAYTNLQDALIAGAACPDLDSIFVAQGTYYPSPMGNRDTSFWIPDSVVLLGGFPGGGGELEERNWECHETILSGDIGMPGDSTDNSYHVIRTINVDSTTILDGFTITGGYADGSYPNNVGGGWYNDGSGVGNSSNPTIRHCRFVDNYGVAGGAMYNYGFDGGESSPALKNCVLSGNTASREGGAMYNNGLEGESSPVLTNCDLLGNYAFYNGGAMYNGGVVGGESSPALINCVLSGNTANGDGGAMYNGGIVGGESSPALINCVLSGNTANGDGGAMYNGGVEGESSPIITNSIFYNNHASNLGPVLFNLIASPSISYSMFGVDFNVVNEGGGTLDNGNNKFSTDPLFVLPIEAGQAPTTAGDFHLLATSPSIDMGDNSANSEIYDLDGLSRIYNGTIDMGAYEWRPYCLPDTVYLDENGDAMVVEEELIGELPEFTGCMIDTVLAVPEISCSDTVVLYNLFLIRDGQDTVFRCGDTIWVLDTIAPVIDMVEVELMLDNNCMVTMPDLSSFVSDNCAIDTMFQSPEVGESLGFPGSMVVVTLTATDSSGNITVEMIEIEVQESAPVLPLNCRAQISPAIHPDGTITITVNDLITNASCLANHDVEVYNQWGGVIWQATGLRSSDYVMAGVNLCAYLGEILEFSVGNELGRCTATLLLDENSSVEMISAFGTTVNQASDLGIPTARIDTGLLATYCGYVPDPSLHQPKVIIPCSVINARSSDTPYKVRVQPDWVEVVPCNEASDTAEIIYRTWEVFDKAGNLTTLTDTIVVIRLPKLTPGAFVSEAEDTAYCELEAVTHKDEALKRYASWKQPVGLHDYELPYTKLRGVTYEIPASIILAGLANAFTQGRDVYEEYLECVILRKANGVDSVTIGDIVSGNYLDELITNATTEQKRYGFLQALFELNEDPLVFLLGAGAEFYPYLLLEEGDWILSEGGNYEKVTADWFYSGNGINPYWFSGGWPSIYGSGDCVSYCDIGRPEEFGCIRVLVPSLSIEEGMEGRGCDTICLTEDVHCGITIEQDPQTAWTRTGMAESCPQTRGMDTWITQTCWGETENFCDPKVEFVGTNQICVLSNENPDQLVGEYHEDGQGLSVEDYECSDKAVKIHLSQWQTLIDTIGPVFDFCYPYQAIIGVPGTEGPAGPGEPGGGNENSGPVAFALPAKNISLSDNECFTGEEFWDHKAIRDAIRKGRQHELANRWERCNPTTYRVTSHDCSAEVFVPDVQVIDNCSGIHSIKAMVGQRVVALEKTNVELRISRKGDTCYVNTYSHTTDPINVPFNGCDGEMVEVRYEAADNCWNQSEWYKYIRIVDDAPPTVIADAEVNVPLHSKIAWVPAETFDEGSWDNCSTDLKLTRRSDWEYCIDICPDAASLPEDGYHSWIEVLDALGIDRADATTAAGGGIVGASGVNDRIDIDDLSLFLSEGEVEEYFLHQIIWMWEDGQRCGQKVVHAWLFALASYLAENCSSEDEHGNRLDVRVLESIFDNLFGQPGYGNELALMGGGWAQSAPFKCEDACLPGLGSTVAAELLVMDACCNWAVGWSDVTVEDKSQVRVVRELPDLEISCEAYNIFYKDVVEAAAALGENGSVTDTSGIFAALDSALGGYVKTWVNNQNQPTDIDGNILSDSVLEFDYYNVACAEKTDEEQVMVENHDGSTNWRTVVSKTTYLDTSNIAAANGIIGVNCSGTCVQDIWVDLDECGQGIITRRFLITSGCGPKAPAREVEQVINVRSACEMRESMFDLPVNLGTKVNPLCLPQGLSDHYLPDTIGSMTMKPHLNGQLCNSFAIGHEVKELTVLGSVPVELGMKKYEITWSAIDWCAPYTSTDRKFAYTQEVIAVIDPACVVGASNDTTTTDTAGSPIVSEVVQKDLSEIVLKEQKEKAVTIKESGISEIGDGTNIHSIQSSRASKPTGAFDSSRELQPLVLYQNRPNPFNGETIIGFRLPKATQATLSIYDVTGHMIKLIEGDYAAGYNEVLLKAQDLGITGVLYYQLDTEDYVATKRMVIVK